MKTESLKPEAPENEANEVQSENPMPISAPSAMTLEEIEELKTAAAKAKDHWDQLVRATADFDNFKKRVAREKQEASKFAHESLLQKLIPVLDNFDKALSAAQTTQGASTQSLQTGIAMVHQQLKSILTEVGLEEMDATDKPFDPNWHEALSQQDSPDLPEGHVLQQLRKGYKLRDRLLRPAGVVVAKRPSA